MDVKDGIIGALLIGIVALAGAIGYLSVTLPGNGGEEDDDEDKEYIYIYQTPPTEEEPDLAQGLPVDWSMAPNRSYIMLFNGTNTVKIELEDILKYINAYEETKGEKYTYRKRLETRTVVDQYSGYYVTGVDILELLHVFDTDFTGTIKLEGSKGLIRSLTYDVKELVYKAYDNEEDVIIGLAANKTWLAESPIGEQCGNFSIFGKDIEPSLNHFENITVLSNWTIDVYYGDPVNGYEKLSLDAYNLTQNPDYDTYTYYDTGWFNYNRTYWGKYISEIVNYTAAKGKNYTLRFICSDGIRPSYDGPAYNWTDVENHLANNGTNIIGNHVDYVNGTGKNDDISGVPIAATDLKMMLVFKQQMRTEYGWWGGVANYPWPYPTTISYPPFEGIIPGRIRGSMAGSVIGLNITIHGSRT